jgi:hypothetical protein
MTRIEPWRLSRAGRRLGENACWRGVIAGLGRLDQTTSAPDGNTREMGWDDSGPRGPTSAGADLDCARQARSMNRWETIVMPGHRCAEPLS